MGILGKILGLGIGQTVGTVADVIDKFVETDEEKAAAELVKMKLFAREGEAQVELNKKEAGHRSVFVAGWRPATGWICNAALAWGWIIAPILMFLYPDHEMPAIQVQQAISVIMAMLGMGALRSWEKKNGLTS